MDKAAIGIVGLGVMGHSLALNMERNGNSVAGYNQDESVARAFRDGAAKGKRITVAESNAAMAELLERPRCILMMVPAGDPVDAVISELKPHLAAGDTLIDGGNSYFLDTERRLKQLEPEGFNYIGMGVSGGEEGRCGGRA